MLLLTFLCFLVSDQVSEPQVTACRIAMTYGSETWFENIKFEKRSLNLKSEEIRPGDLKIS